MRDYPIRDHYLCGVARSIAIDFGIQRTGLAISDPLGMIANGLDTVETRFLMQELKQLHRDPGYDVVVVGQPRRMDGRPSEIEQNIQLFIVAFEKEVPNVQVKRFDERFTSKIAAQTMISAGSTKKQRRNKGSVDKISATLILQEYLNSKSA